MDRTLGKKFIDEITDEINTCMDWIEMEYDLGPVSLPDRNKDDEYHKNTFPKRIKKKFPLFDKVFSETRLDAIMDEIADNLNECRDQYQKNKYIFSFLKPFKRYNKIRFIRSEVFSDEWVAMMITFEIYYRSQIENNPLDDKAKNFCREILGPDLDSKCKAIIEEYINGDKRCYYIPFKFYLLRAQYNDDPSMRVEVYICRLIEYLETFANKLDALLLELGQNLISYQEEIDIYIINRRNFDVIAEYIGSVELAKKCIAIAQPPFPETTPQFKPEPLSEFIYTDKITVEFADEVQPPFPETTPTPLLEPIPLQISKTAPPQKAQIPPELDTEQAKKYFLRAVNAGLMTLSDNGYKWNAKKIKLGYFCSKVYDHPRPMNAIEQFFNVKKISASISQAENHTKNPNKRKDVEVWINDMNERVFYD